MQPRRCRYFRLRSCSSASLWLRSLKYLSASCGMWLVFPGQETRQLSVLPPSERGGVHVNNGCSQGERGDVESRQRRAAPHLIMNQLIPLQMMDRVAMTTEAVLPRAWRRCLFPRTTQSRFSPETGLFHMRPVHVKTMQVHDDIPAPPTDVAALGTCVFVCSVHATLISLG